MSTADILNELSKLEPSEREKIWQRLEEIELAEMEETPAMLTAIDEGRRSMRDGKTHTVEEARDFCRSL